MTPTDVIAARRPSLRNTELRGSAVRHRTGMCVLMMISVCPCWACGGAEGETALEQLALDNGESI